MELFLSRLGSGRDPPAGPRTSLIASGNANRGSALRVQKCTVGRSQHMSSSVPAPTNSGSRVGCLVAPDPCPAIGRTHRLTVRPLVGGDLSVTVCIGSSGDGFRSLLLA